MDCSTERVLDRGQQIDLFAVRGAEIQSYKFSESPPERFHITADLAPDMSGPLNIVLIHPSGEELALEASRIEDQVVELSVVLRELGVHRLSIQRQMPQVSAGKVLRYEFETEERL